MAFNFGNQGTQPTPGLNLGQQPQQTSAFGFSNPQQQGFQFGSTAPSFGFGGQPTATTSAPSTGFSFGTPAAQTGGLSFGTPSTGFGAPQPNPTPTNTFGLPSFGAVPASGTTTGFSFAQPTTAPAPGTTGGSTFGSTFGTAATTAPFFSGSGGSFSFGATTTAATPQFGAPMPNPTVASQPFSFSTPVTSTTSLFGGTGFTLGSSAAPTSQAQTLFPGGNVFGGFGTPSNVPIATVAPATSGGFQLTSAPSMPLLSSATTAAPLPTPFGPTSTGLSFETGAASQGFSFGVTPTSSAITPFVTPLPSSGMTVNITTASIAPTIKTNTISVTPGFGALPTFSAATATSTAATPNTGGLMFGTPSASKISLTGFTPTVTSTTTAPGLSFGLPMGSAAAPGTTTTSGVAAVTTPAATTTTTAPFSMGTSSLFAPTFPKLATTSANSSVVPTTTSTSTTSTTFPSTGLPSLLTSTTPSISLATTATDTTVAVVQPGSQMTFRQLEEAINKWNLELGDQERIFLNQATQVNAWDRLLITNGQKIKDLHESVERVKLEQERLDHELDFIVSQQRELEDLLTPLEKALDDTPALSIQQHADLQREHTYHMAEKVDGQLKRMAEDIKEIIEHLNTSQNQDDTDPMQQVSKILNAHMDALHWVDQNTELLQKKLEEISKVVDSTKKDQDRSWRISYN